jgi:polygalacturonase
MLLQPNKLDRSPIMRLLLLIASLAFQPALFDSAFAQSSSPRQFNVQDYGATGDGITKNTVAIQKALDACATAGGGDVKVPAGKYLTGSLEMKSHVHLNLAAGAVLVGSSDVADYTLGTARWEGQEKPAYLALIRADHAEDIAITGSGTIQGDAKVGTLRNPRGPALIEPVECKTVVLDGLTLHGNRMWTVHPTYCQNIKLTNLTIQTTGANSDGIDPDSCQDVTIDHCSFETGDDNIAIKSGKGQEGVRVGRPSQNITITNCTFLKGAAAVALGSELSGGISDVQIRHCTFKKGWMALELKSREGRAGYIRNVIADDLDVGPEPLLGIETSYKYNPDPQGVEGPAGLTKFENITISNVRINGKAMVKVEATPNIPVDGLTLSNITGTCTEPWVIKNAKNVVLRDIHVSGFAGDFLSLENATGTGLDQTNH